MIQQLRSVDLGLRSPSFTTYAVNASFARLNDDMVLLLAYSNKLLSNPLPSRYEHVR
jgi:hypothetical protein